MKLPSTPGELRAEAQRQRRVATGTSHDSPRNRAYHHLGVDPNAVLLGPKCTPFFDEIGGVPVVLAALRASPLPEARAFMAIYDDPTLAKRNRDAARRRNCASRSFGEFRKVLRCKPPSRANSAFSSPGIVRKMRCCAPYFSFVWNPTML